MKRFLAAVALVCGLCSSTLAADTTKLIALQNGATGTGDGVVLDVTPFTTVSAQVTISATATVTFEATSDGSIWTALVCTAVSNTSGTLVTTATATGLYKCNVAGLQQFRSRISSFGSGTVDVDARATTAEFSPGGGGGGSVNNSVSTTGAAVPSQATMVGGTDGANLVVPKVLSATPGASDPAFVVRGIDPNLAANDSTLSTLRKPTLPATAASTPVVLSDGRQESLYVGLNGALYTRGGGPVTFNCYADNIAATLTQLTNCGAPGVGLKYYITSIVAQSTTATAGQFLLRYGTAANCGTGTTSIFPAGGTVVRYAAPANTAAPLVVNFPTPIAAAANNLLCVIGVATNTVTIDVTGFVAP